MENTYINDCCIICYLDKSKILLCNKCKYLYCADCSKKVNNKCSICFRINTIGTNTNEIEIPENYNFIFLYNVMGNNIYAHILKTSMKIFIYSIITIELSITSYIVFNIFRLFFI